MKRTRRITITTVERQSVQIQLPEVRAHCPVCKREVETVSQVQAAEVIEVDGPTLDRFIADGHIHGVHTVSGSLRVCKESLFIINEPAKHAEGAKLVAGEGI
jgi:hypothetical protein